MIKDFMTEHNHYNGNPSQYLQRVDFVDLVNQLWKGRKTILIAVFIAILLSIGYIFLAKQKWVSTAILTQPDVGQITGYTNALNVMYGSNAPQVNDVQKNFVERFSSAFSALSESLENIDEPEKLTIEPAVKNQSLPLKVTYTGPNAEFAQKMLAQYIQQVDENVAKELEVDLASSIKSKIHDLQQLLVNQEKVVVEQKDLRVAQINQALTVAEQANIKKPQVQQADQVSQDTMFMLGSDALSSMMKNEASRPLPFNDNYYQTRRALLDVSNLLSDNKVESIKADQLHSYRYVMKPTLPLRRDSPKRILVLILGVILGGIIGSGIVLGRNAFKISKMSN